MVQFLLRIIIKVEIMAEQNKAQLKKNLKDTNQWSRILYMVLFWIILYFVMMVVGVIVFIQVLFALFTGSDNENLRKFGADLTQYIHQIISFLTYNENRKPFPFGAWGTLEEPKEDVVDVDEDIIEIEPTDDKSSS